MELLPFGRLIQRCPQCGHASWRNVLQKRVTESKVVSGELTSWSPGGQWAISEPSSSLVESYELLQGCRACGHTWKTMKTEKEMLR